MLTFFLSLTSFLDEITSVEKWKLMHRKRHALELFATYAGDVATIRVSHWLTVFRSGAGTLGQRSIKSCFPVC